MQTTEQQMEAISSDCDDASNKGLMTHRLIQGQRTTVANTITSGSHDGKVVK